MSTRTGIEIRQDRPAISHKDRAAFLRIRLEILRNFVSTMRLWHRTGLYSGSNVKNYSVNFILKLSKNVTSLKQERD